MSRSNGLHRLYQLIGQPQAGSSQLKQLEKQRLLASIARATRQQVRHGPKHGANAERLIDLRVQRLGGNVMHGKPPGND